VLQLLQNTFVISAAVGVGAIMLMWPSSSKRSEDDDETLARTTPVGSDGPQPPEGHGVVILEGASVDAFLADLGLADPIGTATVVGTLDDVLDDTLADTGADAPETVAVGAQDEPTTIEDPDEAAARWLAEELAALGIEL
jgi:hypothetical protein